MQLNAKLTSVESTSLKLDGGIDLIAYLVGNRVGESPAWHSEHQAIYWIDVRGQLLQRLWTTTQKLEKWVLPDVVGAMALCPSNKVWLALRHSLAVLDTATSTLTQIESVEEDRPDNRLNDGKVSPTGQWFVFGSMDDRPQKSSTGALYCANANGYVKRLWDGLIVCNGIAFSPDATRIYFSDSFAGKVFVAEWNEATGSMESPSLFCLLNDAQGRPDGAVVDSEGNYWSAGVSAGKLNALDTNGTLFQTIVLPCRAPTMPTFGGDTGNTLFITSLVRDTWDTWGRLDGALLSMPSPAQGEHASLLNF